VNLLSAYTLPIASATTLAWAAFTDPHPATGGRGVSGDEDMNAYKQSIERFLTSEDGPTAVEYAVMLALIVVVCLTAIQNIGTRANATFQSVAAKLPTGGAS
jgi:pilus assembly protein Flp/PilA